MSNIKKSGDKKKAKVDKRENLKFCANPYNDHGAASRRSDRAQLITITDVLVDKARLLKINLEIDGSLCKTCYNKINQGKFSSSSVVPSQTDTCGSGLAPSGGAKRKRSATIGPKSQASSSSDSDVPSKTQKTVASGHSSSSSFDEDIKQDFPKIVDKLNEILIYSVMITN